jgi:fluoroacetyl-CoA thioesterase
MDIDPEAVGEVMLTVTPAETAARSGLELGEAYPEVLATACMVREMERAAAKLMRPLLGPGQLSVGVKVDVHHVAPTPVGGLVVTRARLAGREGRLYWFEVWAEDGGGTIGKGRHARAVIDEARLLAAAETRR